MTPDDLELLRIHLRIDDYDDASDTAYIEQIFDAAKAVVVSVTERTEEELCPNGVMPNDLKQACFMVAAHLHDNRESETSAAYRTDPYVEATLKKYTKLSKR